MGMPGPSPSRQRTEDNFAYLTHKRCLEYTAEPLDPQRVIVHVDSRATYAFMNGRIGGRTESRQQGKADRYGPRT